MVADIVFRIGRFIDQSVIDGGQTGGVGVPKPVHLNRGWLANEDAKAVGRGMARQVDEYIYSVIADLSGNALVG